MIDWSAVGSWAGTVGAWLGAAGAIGAACYAHGQKKAAARSADEARRSADAAATMAAIEQERRADEVSEAERNRVRFVLDPAGKYAYLLRNAGTDTAYSVHVDTHGMGAVDSTEDFDEFPSDYRHRYVLMPGSEDQNDHILVTWHYLPERSDPPQSQKLFGA